MDDDDQFHMYSSKGSSPSSGVRKFELGKKKLDFECSLFRHTSDMSY
jgi:hypothetical protein